MASMISSEQELFNELSYYTMSHGDPSFIHQYVVDAFAAQNPEEEGKPIRVAFALVGLYLSIEKNFSGREVQKTHMKLARKRKQWPRFMPPRERGGITISNVMAVPAGKARDEMIDKWCRSVWDAWKGSREQVAALLESELGWC